MSKSKALSALLSSAPLIMSLCVAPLTLACGSPPLPLHPQPSGALTMNQSPRVTPSGFGALSIPGPMRLSAVGEEQTKIAYFDSHPTQQARASLEVIVLLHGLGEHAGYWRENVSALIAAGYRVIAPDLAGHGRSDKPNRAYSMRWQAGLVMALCEQLQVKRPYTLVGHSMGGQVALRLALMSPERVKSLALIAPAGIETFSPSEAAWLRKMSTAKGFASRGPAALRAHFQRNVFGRWGHVAEEHLQERIKLRDAPGFHDYIQAVVASVYGMLDDRAAHELSAVTPPVYLLFGAQDRLIPNPVLHGGKTEEVLQRAKATLKSLVEVTLLPEVGHMPQIEAPHRTNRLILNAAALKRPSQTHSSSPSATRSQAMEPILIKRYPNRRLYDTGKSSYVTLDELAEDLSAGRRIRVKDNKTGEDITRKVLIQALLTEGQQHKLNCLPQDFLFTLLQLEDQTTLSMFSHYIRATLSSFSVAQSAMSQNLELMRKWAPQPTELIAQLSALLIGRGPQGKG